MHLQPITPVDTTPDAGDQPLSPGQCGSKARLAVLLYLANRPLGASRDVLSDVTGLVEPELGTVLRGLSACERIACDKMGPNGTWYVPAARAGMTRHTLANLREDPIGLADVYVLGMVRVGGPE